MRGAIALPIAVDPVADTRGMRSSSASCTARSAPPITSSKSPSGTSPKRSAARREQRRRRDRREGRPLGRLPDHRVAADQGEGGVPAPHRDREVERADHGDGPERVPRLRQSVARALGGDRLPVQLPREPDREVADVDHLLDLAEPLLRDLPHLERDERAERLLLAAELLAEEAHELTAPRRGDVAPRLEGGDGAGDGGVGGRRVRARDPTDLLAGDRRANDELALGHAPWVDAQALEEPARGGSDGRGGHHRKSRCRPAGRPAVRRSRAPAPACPSRRSGRSSGRTSPRPR